MLHPFLVFHLTSHRSRFETCTLLQNFDYMVLIGIDTQVACDGKRLLDDFQRRQTGILQERARGRMSVRATASDRSKSKLRLDHVTRSGDDESGSGSATTSIASSRRKIRSVRQSFASSTAERMRCP